MVNVDEAIRDAQAQIIHRNMPTASISGLMVAALCVSVFWGVVNQTWLLLWFGALALLVSARMVRWMAFRGPRLLEAGAARWLRETGRLSTATAVVWGAGATFMIPSGLPTYQLAFAFALFSMAVAGMFSYNVHYPTFLGFYAPTISSGIVALGFQQTLLAWAIAGGMLLFTVVALQATWTLNRAFLESQKLRFENIDLVEQLTIQKTAADMANLAKSRFLAAASHDLRQPMHAITLYLATLKGAQLPAQVSGTLQNIGQCAQTMEKMFTGLLDISRLDAGIVKPDVEVFPIAQLLDRLYVELAPLARARNLELHVMPCSAFVEGDPALLGRILLNLANNAIRYTARGKVLIGARRRGGVLRLGVYDTGPGIEHQHLDRIFEEFYQINPTQQADASGLGLGLAIVNRLVLLTSSHLTWRSVPGRGSVFTVDVPLAEAASPPVRERVAHEGDPFTDALVVVIDDNLQVLEATRTLLETWGCEVVAASSGTQVLERMATHARVPRAIVCDYRLPGESGIAVIQRLRSEFNHDIPALLITGDTGPEQITEIGATGLPVLYKPLRTEQLRSRLHQLLSDELVPCAA
jgi:signal transduction histidine kinase